KSGRPEPGGTASFWAPMLRDSIVCRTVRLSSTCSNRNGKNLFQRVESWLKERQQETANRGEVSRHQCNQRGGPERCNSHVEANTEFIGRCSGNNAQDFIAMRFHQNTDRGDADDAKDCRK